MEPPQIIVADADVIDRRYSSQRLKQAGYWVAAAADGVQASEVIGRVKPSLILLDFALPRVKSVTVLAGVRCGLSRHIRMVITGDRASLVDLRQSAEVCVDGFLETPIRADDLLLYAATTLGHAADVE